MSVARASYGTTYSAAPLGVTTGAPGAYNGVVTTVQAPPIVLPPQPANATASTAPATAYVAPSTTVVPAAMQLGAGSALPAGVTAYTGAVQPAQPAVGYTAAAAAGALFDQLGRNHDGYLSRAEFGALNPQGFGQQQPQPQSFAQPVQPFAQAGQFAAAAMPPFEAPPPKRMTDGLPNPASVEAQKVAYARQLETQFEAGKKTIEGQTQQAKAILHQQAEEKKLEYRLEIDKQLMEQEFNLDHQTHQQVMQLHKAAFEQRQQLEQQASTLTLEYNEKKLVEALEQRKYDLQIKHNEMREIRHKEMQDKLAVQQGLGGPQPGGGMPNEPVQAQEPYNPPQPGPQSMQYPGASPASHGATPMAQQPPRQVVSQCPPQTQQPQSMHAVGTPMAAQQTQYEQMPAGDPVYGSAQYTSQQQFGSTTYGSAAQFGQPGGTPTAGYAGGTPSAGYAAGTPSGGFVPPPTQYAPAPTSCGAPQTSFGAPPTACAAPATVMGGVAPQTSIGACGH